jgi:hypothetical protein
MEDDLLNVSSNFRGRLPGGTAFQGNHSLGTVTACSMPSRCVSVVSLPGTVPSGSVGRGLSPVGRGLSPVGRSPVVLAGTVPITVVGANHGRL